MIMQFPFVLISTTSDASQTQAPQIQGIIKVPSTEDLPSDMSMSAIYITARPDRPDSVPKAILDGTRGKAPPVFISRIPGIRSFPARFSLTAKDVSVEGDWWYNDDLIISIRLDSDGVAATRDPADLVGRALYRSGSSEAIEIELQGRGIAGKFVTRKQR